MIAIKKNKNETSDTGSILIAHIAAIILFFYGVGSIYFGEIIPAGGGLGFDGVFLGHLANDFHRLVFEEKAVDMYYLKKSLPSAIIYYVSGIFDISGETENIIVAFQLLNLACLIASGYLWWAIARHEKISRKGMFLGIFLLYLNFGILKFSFYYPVLTDTAALLMSMAMLYFFIAKRHAGLLAVGIVGAFVWPTLLVSSLILYVMPNKGEYGTSNKAKTRSTQVSIVIALFISFCSAVSYIVLEKKITGGALPVWREAFWISLFLLFLYCCFGIREILASAFELRWFPAAVKAFILRFATACAVYFSVQFFMKSITGPPIMAILPNDMFFNWLLEPVAKPLVFIVAHSFYFGPVFLLAVFLWKSICRIACDYGVGMSVLFVVFFLLSILSESRCIIGVLPFLILFIVLAATDLVGKQFFLVSVFVLAIVISRFWLPINHSLFESSMHLSFPGQLYLMNFGPWMSHTSYWIEVFVMVLQVAVLAFFIKAGKRAGNDYSGGLPAKETSAR